MKMKAFELHGIELENYVGKERASTANVGWEVTDTSICSKVYPISIGQPCLYFTTYHNLEGDIIEYETEEDDV